MPDETITCADCTKPFVHSEGAQAFFKEKGFAQKPKRCPPCRKVRKDKHAPKQ